MNVAVSWVTAQCSLLEVYRRFRGAYCLRNRPDDGEKAPSKGR
jgi:hypothetical protein